jgi:hypothetical protein
VLDPARSDAAKTSLRLYAIT